MRGRTRVAGKGKREGGEERERERTPHKQDLGDGFGGETRHLHRANCRASNASALSVSLSLCLSVSPSACLSPSVSHSLSVSVSVSVCLSVCPPAPAPSPHSCTAHALQTHQPIYPSTDPTRRPLPHPQPHLRHSFSFSSSFFCASSSCASNVFRDPSAAKSASFESETWSFSLDTSNSRSEF